MFLPSNITLSPGDSGDFVAELQRRLAQRDLLSEGNVNGIYDGITTNAVQSFQFMHGLTADGIAGPETIRRLNSFGSAGTTSGGGETADTTTDDDVKEGGDKFDDFILTQQAHGHTQPQIDAAGNIIKKDDTTIDDMRSKGDEGQGKARGDSALWQDGKQAQPDMDLSKQTQLQEQVRNTQMDIENLERTQGNKGQDQIKIDQSGIRAKTAMDEINQIGKQDQMRDPALAIDPQQPVQQQAQNLPYMQDQAQMQQPMAMRQQGQQGNLQQSTSLTPPRTSGLTPEMQRTEARLNAGDRAESKQEGMHLQDRGVRDNGTVNQGQLGQLSPAPTPNLGPQQQVGR